MVLGFTGIREVSLLRASDLQFPRLAVRWWLHPEPVLRLTVACTASGAFCQNTPLCVARLLTIWPLGSKSEAGSSPAQASEGMGIPHRPLFVGQGSFRDQRFQERDSKALPSGGGGSKDLGVTLKMEHCLFECEVSFLSSLFNPHKLLIEPGA